MLDTGKHQAEHVEVPLDQDDAPPLRIAVLAWCRLYSCLPLWKIGDSGVEVLRLAGNEEPSAESHGPAAEIANREEQPRPEPGHHLPVVPLGREPGFQQHLVFDPQLLHRRRRRPSRGA